MHEPSVFCSSFFTRYLKAVERTTFLGRIQPKNFTIQPWTSIPFRTFFLVQRLFLSHTLFVVFMFTFQEEWFLTFRIHSHIFFCCSINYFIFIRLFTRAEEEPQTISNSNKECFSPFILSRFIAARHFQSRLNFRCDLRSEGKKNVWYQMVLPKEKLSIVKIHMQCFL